MQILFEMKIFFIKINLDRISWNCFHQQIIHICLFVYPIIDQTVSYIFGRGNALLKSS